MMHWLEDLLVKTMVVLVILSCLKYLLFPLACAQEDEIWDDPRPADIIKEIPELPDPPINPGWDYDELGPYPLDLSEYDDCVAVYRKCLRLNFRTSHAHRIKCLHDYFNCMGYTVPT